MWINISNPKISIYPKKQWVGDGQGGLACCNTWGRKELDTTERLKWTEQVKYEKYTKY